MGVFWEQKEKGGGQGEISWRRRGERETEKVGRVCGLSNKEPQGTLQYILNQTAIKDSISLYHLELMQ